MSYKASRNVSILKTNSSESTISVIILAAGQANRMRSHGPRPLIKIKPNTNLITHQINILNKHLPKANIILVCGYEADKVMNNTPSNIVKIQNESYETTNVVRSIGVGLRANISSRVLIIYGDLLFNEQTIKYADLTKTSLFLDQKNPCGPSDVGCTFNEKNHAEQLLYELPNKWVQIMCLMGPELNAMQHLSWNEEKYNLFGFEAINEIITAGGTFTVQSPKNMKIIDIDSSKDLQKVNTVI
jgi:choline kinase